MDMEMYMDIRSADFWYMRNYQDTTLICIYIALRIACRTEYPQSGGVSYSICFHFLSVRLFELLPYQLDTVALRTVLT